LPNIMLHHKVQKCDVKILKFCYTWVNKCDVTRLCVSAWTS